MRFVLFLHVAAAIVLIGPPTMAAMASPRFVRQGTEGVPVLRFLNRTTRRYGFASIAVWALGAALVGLDKHASWHDFWISASMTLFVVYLVLLYWLVERGQRKALRHIERGESPEAFANRIASGAGMSALVWFAILLLMVYKP